MSYFGKEACARPVGPAVLLQITHGKENSLTRVTILATEEPSKEAALRFGDTHGPSSGSRFGSLLYLLPP